MRRSFTKTFFALGVLFILIQGCTVSHPTEDDAVRPVLSDLNVPDLLYMQTPNDYPLSVRVSDPQGWEDIDVVRAMVYPEGNRELLWQDTLADDGERGDIVPRDGIFFGCLNVTFAGGMPGNYTMAILAEDKASHFSDTLFSEVLVIEGKKNSPPVISNPVVVDTLTETSIFEVFISIEIGDPDGLENIDSVYFDIYPPWSPTSTFTERLLDDGREGDIQANDGIFSFSGNLANTLRSVGEYLVRFQAVDEEGAESEAVIARIYVSRENRPPVLSDLIVPDEISRSSAQPFTVSVLVDDPQGLGDVQSVYFNSTKPDGNPAQGNPFFLYDDGDSLLHGDEMAGDGRFSLIVEITPQNDTGIYRFDFFAEDYFGAVSDSLTHYLMVTE